MCIVGRPFCPRFLDVRAAPNVQMALDLIDGLDEQAATYVMVQNMGPEFRTPSPDDTNVCEYRGFAQQSNSAVHSQRRIGENPNQAVLEGTDRQTMILRTKLGPV
eukprot:6356165-Amphidinium_carterae.1